MKMKEIVLREDKSLSLYWKPSYRIKELIRSNFNFTS